MRPERVEIWARSEERAATLLEGLIDARRPKTDVALLAERL